MDLRKCRACSYWVLPDARSCPNCGIRAPASETSPFNRDPEDAVRFLTTVVLTIAGTAAGLAAGFARAPDDPVIIPIWALSGLLIGWLAGDLLGGMLGIAFVRMRDRYFPTHVRNSLQAEETRLRR